MSSKQYNIEKTVADEFEALKQDKESSSQTLHRLCNQYATQGIYDDLRYRSVAVRECMAAVPGIGKDLKVAQEKLITIASNLHRLKNEFKKKELARKLVDTLSAVDREVNDQLHSDKGWTPAPSYQTGWKTANNTVTQGAATGAPLTATTDEEADGGTTTDSAKEES